MMAICDTLIIGAGPAGLACASQLFRASGHRIMILDQGSSIGLRHCPAMESGHCVGCRVCNVVSGIGGASGILGGKLCFFPAGAGLAQHVGCSSDQANALVLGFLSEHGITGFPGALLGKTAGSERYDGAMSLKQYTARPMVKPDMMGMFLRITSQLASSEIPMIGDARIIDIMPASGLNRFLVIYERSGVRQTLLVRDSVVLASGRSGATWLSSLLARLGVRVAPTAYDVGVRLEVPTSSVASLPVQMQDPKFKLNAGLPNEVRTLCWCRSGDMCLTSLDGITCVDGHFGDKWSPATSVSVVRRFPGVPNDFGFTSALSQFSRKLHKDGPVRESLASFLGSSPRCMPSGLSLTRLAAHNGRIGQLLSSSLREGVAEMLEHLDALTGGHLYKNAVLYAPVIDRFWDTPALDRHLMTGLPGLYVAGDATGLARGIVQAICGGLIAASAIAGTTKRHLASNTLSPISVE